VKLFLCLPGGLTYVPPPSFLYPPSLLPILPSPPSPPSPPAPPFAPCILILPFSFSKLTVPLGH
jgi:hypothetical protein